MMDAVRLTGGATETIATMVGMLGGALHSELGATADDEFTLKEAT